VESPSCFWNTVCTKMCDCLCLLFLDFSFAQGAQLIDLTYSFDEKVVLQIGADDLLG
jgi:hypothetical protein